MTFILSITGLFKMLLMIIGFFVLLRFIGQLMQAKRNIAAQNEYNRQKANFENQKSNINKNMGKINVLNNKNIIAKDIDYEEIK